jgi:hypothetical protein
MPREADRVCVEPQKNQRAHTTKKKKKEMEWISYNKMNQPPAAARAKAFRHTHTRTHTHTKEGGRLEPAVNNMERIVSAALPKRENKKEGKGGWVGPKRLPWGRGPPQEKRTLFPFCSQSAGRAAS